MKIDLCIQEMKSNRTFFIHTINNKATTIFFTPNQDSHSLVTIVRIYSLEYFEFSRAITIRAALFDGVFLIQLFRVFPFFLSSRVYTSNSNYILAIRNIKNNYSR